ncbi:putative DNA-dependent RNA polymerase subunit Rpb3/Rbp11 [Namao virus]|nr:putative DNA-dependent RNA polymerase subunit Rpb3/Rbp11 [Namao virus]
MEITIEPRTETSYPFVTHLRLRFKGSAVNCTLLNTIRRTAMELIPIYGFDRSDIQIVKNTSVYNNDEISLRVSLLPIIKVENTVKTLERIFEFENEINMSFYDQSTEDINVLKKKEEEKNLEKKLNFIMEVNVKNKNSQVIAVTTDDAHFFYNGESVKVNPYFEKNIKFLIVHLKPGEEIVFTAYSSLYIPLHKKGSVFSAVSNAIVYEPNEETSNDKEDDLYLELFSIGQLPESEIYMRSLTVIKMKLELLEALLIKKINHITQDKLRGNLKINNESFTFGNLITHFIQDHPDILFAGCEVENLLVRSIVIKYEKKSPEVSLKKIITESFAKAIEIISLCQEKSKKLF